MNAEFTYKLAHLVLKHEKELHVTNNEVAMIRRFLDMPGERAARTDRKGLVFVHNPAQYILNNFNSLIRDQFPHEYSTI